jgi:thiosulfate/3-mercaptopyruvate sulfurtransferase
VDYLLFEVGTDARDAYLAGHIPGAGYFDTNWVERPPHWNRLPDDELEPVLLAQGITHDKTVVLYRRRSHAAARVAVILLYAGVGEVRLLDGGFEAWCAAGYPLETGEKPLEPVPTFGISLPAWAEVFVDTEGVRKMLADENSVVVSVRTWAEFIGETSGYAFIKPKGRIAGAVWGQAGKDKDGMQDYRRPDGRVRPLEEIAARWRAAGITPEKRVAFYCGTGWRASEAFFYAVAMGWKQIAVYDGGWLEWSRDPENPVETGLP